MYPGTTIIRKITKTHEQGLRPKDFQLVLFFAFVDSLYEISLEGLELSALPRIPELVAFDFQ
jgi:hypothetical protein